MRKVLILALIFNFTEICTAGKKVVGQWYRWEHDLSTKVSCKDSVVNLKVVFSGPNGIAFSTPAFSNDGKKYHFRAAFPVTGLWRWKTSCDKPIKGIVDRKGKVLVKKYEGENTLYKHGNLKVSDDKRYLVHADGTPFLWMGDTGWAVQLRSTMEEWKYYVDTRVKQNFSVIQISPTGFIKEKTESSIGAVSFDKNGKPDTVFWKDMDDKIAYANDQGLMVFMVGIGGKLNELFSQNSANQNLVTYLTARFAGNMVVFSPGFDQKFDKGNQRVAEELSFITSQLVTQHPGTHYNTIVKYRNDPSLDFCGLQSGHQNGDLPKAYRAARAWTLDLWNAAPVKPVINIEAMYDGYGNNNGPNWREKDVRKLGWISWLSGSKGYTYGAGDVRPKVPHGNGGIWTFNTDSTTFDYWRKAIAWPSAAQMTIMHDFFKSIDWWNLIPAHELVLNQSEDEMCKMVVSVNKNDNLVVAYLPDNDSIRLNLEGKSGVNKILWLNPVTGQSIEDGKMISTDKIVSFTKPQGWDDALLVLSLEINRNS